MVNITKWILLGSGLILLGLFTKEAATTSLSSTLHRTGTAGASVGGALSGIGSGVGDFFRGMFTPLWEIGNFAKSFGFGSDIWGNSQPDIQAQDESMILTGGGGGFDNAEQQGGGDTGINTDPTPSSPLPVSLNPFYHDERISPYAVTDVVVHGQALPLGTEAIAWYQDAGVTVTPAHTSLVNWSDNSGGGVSDQPGGGWVTNTPTESGGVMSGNTSLVGWGA